MKILDRYIGRTVALNTAIVMAVLLSLYFFSTFVEEMSEVGRGRYTLRDAVQYTVLLMPRLAYELFPLVALLGGMLGLGALATTSELTVIRAAGVSVRRIVISVLKVGLLMVVAVSLLGEGVAPAAEKYARMERARALTEQISVNTEDGLWAREGNTFINIQRLLPNGILTDITLYRLGESKQLLEAVQAQRAEYRQGQWHLMRVKASVFRADGVVLERRESMPWTTSLTPEVFNVVAIPPDKLSIWELYGYVRYLRENGLDASRYEVALWSRAVVPFATAGMVLLAVPFVFGSLRSVGVGQRIMIGALLGIGFYLFNAVFTRFGLVYGLPPSLSATLPTLGVYLLWWLLMRRVV